MIGFDRLDIKILSALQENGRLTKVKLGRLVDLSVSALHERVVRLEKQGIIMSYKAHLNIDSVIKFDTIFVEITLGKHRQSDFTLFQDVIKKNPYIVECLAVSGGIDYILRFVVCNVAQYQNLMDELLDQDIGIDKYFTYVVMKEVKPFAGYPLENLIGIGTENKPSGDTS